MEEEPLVKVKVKAVPLHADQVGSCVAQTILDCSARRGVGVEVDRATAWPLYPCDKDPVPQPGDRSG